MNPQNPMERLYRVALALIGVEVAGRVIRMVMAARNAPLWADVAGYLEVASAMTHPYDTDTREALWIWLVKSSVVLAGGDRIGLHVLGGLLFLASVGIFYRLVWDLSRSKLTTLLAVLFFGNNTFMMEVCAFGTRDSLFLIAVLLLTYFTFAPSTTLSDPRRMLGLAAGAALALGSRITIGPILLVILALGAWWNRKGARFVIVPLVAGFAIMGPYLIYSHQKFGDAYYAANVHARWWRNHEFLNGPGKGKPCETCPTLEEYHRDGMYAGRPVTWFTYIFKYHTLREVWDRTLYGFTNIFVINGSILKAQGMVRHWALYLAYWVGVFALLSSIYRLMLLFPVLILNALMFMVSVDMDPRLYSPAVPFLTGLTALGVSLVCQAAWDLRKPLSALVAQKKVRVS